MNLNKLLVLVIVTLSVIGTYLFGRIQTLNPILSRVVLTPSPAPTTTSVLTPNPLVQKQQPASQSIFDLARSVLNQHPAFRCPDITVIKNWITSTLGNPAGITTKDLDALRNKDELLWACTVYFAKEYAAQSDILKNLPNSQGSQNNQPASNVSHYECVKSSCTEVPGKGIDTCDPLLTHFTSIFHNGTMVNFNSACEHPECQNNSCVIVSGPGDYQCTFDSDCYHSECQGGACVAVSGKSTRSSCYSDTDCKHHECQGGKCVQVNGTGSDTCLVDLTCQSQ